MSATNLYEFPWAGQVRATLIRLDLDQYSANIRDGADVHALAHPVAYLEFHFHTYAAAKTIAITGTLRGMYVTATAVRSRVGERSTRGADASRVCLARRANRLCT
jgi:hypothetical protein